MIDIFVTHFIAPELVGFNDILVDEVHTILRTTQGESSRVRVVVNGRPPPTEEAIANIRRRLSSEVDVRVNDRPGRSDIQPSARNKVLSLARESGCKAFVLLHNDVRPARGWFQHLKDDWRQAEKKWGKDRCIVAPRFIPYHLSQPHPSAVENPPFWEAMRSVRRAAVKSTDEMRAWCHEWRKSGFGFADDEVVCPSTSSTTDDGHILMMFIASPRFFDAVGECDEEYTTANFDDSDWGMRALMVDKKNLKSTGALMGHVEGLTFYTSGFHTVGTDNTQIFIKKWGRPLFDEMHSGELWRRLHHEQRERERH
jgi:GT2 family glycosyltransferase